ncbi:MAG: glycosyltransferase family 4 protein, partial [Bacteroidota bacterium]
MHHSPQRIALICFSHSLGGLELSALRLAATMREKGVETWIVAPPNSPLAERKTNAVIPLITLSPRWKYGDIFTARQLASALKEHRIDVALLMQSKDIHLAVIASTVSPSAKLVFYQQMQFG